MATIDIPELPLGAGHPLPGQTWGDGIMEWYYSGELTYDAEPHDEMVIYFHGSGGGLIPTILKDGFLNEGYSVLSSCYFNSYKSWQSPFRYNYGNTGAPHFSSLWIKHAWWVRSTVEYALTTFTPIKIVLVGHSMGASAVLAYLAGYTGFGGDVPSHVQGSLVAGATVGGLGDLSWNDINRNINSMTNMVALNPTRTIMGYGDNDVFAPPDYVKHIQMALPAVTDTYIVSPGDAPHAWIADPSFYTCGVMWTKQLMDGAPITDRLGNPAVAGLVNA